jgi:hypothetical protein
MKQSGFSLRTITYPSQQSIIGDAIEEAILDAKALARHPSEGWDPVLDFAIEDQRQNWTPACAGVATHIGWRLILG